MPRSACPEPADPDEEAALPPESLSDVSSVISGPGVLILLPRTGLRSNSTGGPRGGRLRARLFVATFLTMGTLLSDVCASATHDLWPLTFSFTFASVVSTSSFLTRIAFRITASPI
jgi:hypothetical protein